MIKIVKEILTTCPFCEKISIRILHTPFSSRKSISKSRFGRGGDQYTKERFHVLSGCEYCKKTKKEVEKALEGKEERTHEERMERWKKRGLPLVIGGK